MSLLHGLIALAILGVLSLLAWVGGHLRQIGREQDRDDGRLR